MTRLDERLVREGYADDIRLARAYVMEGRVMVNDMPAKKPSDAVKLSDRLRLRGVGDDWASRGAKKLLRAFEAFSLNVEAENCIDVGASTGGFTDVMLRRGAKRVYSIDVGYNQLDYRLRVDERVRVMERVNARNLARDMFEDEIGFGATDVSFISLATVLPACLSVLRLDASFVALIKPQFEAKREQVGAKGVVRDREVHFEVIQRVCGAVRALGWSAAGLDFSPITGPEGNIEFLLLIRRECADVVDEELISNVISRAHDKFIK